MDYQKSLKIIAVSGVKGVGKNEVADMLRYILSTPTFLHKYKWYKRFKHWKFFKKWKITSFAYNVKRTLACLLGVSYYEFNNRDFKENVYVELPTLNITKNPTCDVIHDSKFSKLAKTLDQSICKYALTIRQLMQLYATEIMQTYFGRNVWINSTLNQTKSQNIIISDLRFKAELDAVKERNGIVIYIERPGCEFGNHASEKEIKSLVENLEFDYTIKNDSTLEELFNNVKIVVYDIF